MKNYLLLFCLLAGFQSFAQTTSEKEVLKLSAKIFKWEVDNKVDSLENVFHEKFVVVGSDGNSQSKREYLPKLRNGSFVHDSIKVEENTAIVNGNTAVVHGKGMFAVTVSGNKRVLHLSYLEVFSRASSKKPWQVLAMKASVLDK